MTHRFSELMFTDQVKQLQELDGSRKSYARFEEHDFPARDRLTGREGEFISQRDSFYLATISSTGWPYVQHRGGEPGFLSVIDDQTLAFDDYPGNRQFLSFGNIAGDDRVALILMDYPNRRRLKILGHARLSETAREDDGGASRTTDSRVDQRPTITVSIEGFDWNCPKYITRRFTEADIAALLARISALEAANAKLAEAVGSPS